MAAALRDQWAQSRRYRAVLCVALAFAVLRAGIQAAYLAGWLLPETEVTAEGGYVPVDMQVYLDAATRMGQRADLYLDGPLKQVEFFQYTPAFALAFTPFTWLPTGALLTVHSLIHVAAYAWLYALWGRLFRRLGLRQAERALAATLPVWLVYSCFWADWAYLNIYVVMALLGTFLLEAVLDENLGRAALWLAIILQIKPHWAFAAGLPLLCGRQRFFWRLILAGLAGYAVLTGVTMALAGPGYVLAQYGEYARFLANLAGHFPWRGQGSGFQGYNHSVLQTLIFWMGDMPAAARLATAIKVLLCAPLAAMVLRRGGRTALGAANPRLDLAFALYLAGFIWLDWVWELSLGPALFAYLLGTTAGRGRAAWLWVMFLSLALLDIWQLAGVIVFGEDVIAGAYILTDPSIYFPITLVVLLGFYAVLVKRLWQGAAGFAGALQPQARGEA